MIPHTAPALVDRIADHYELDRAALTGPCRERYVAQARHVAMWALKTRYDQLSLVAIAAYLGRTDHSTVLHAVAKIDAQRAADPAFAARLDALLAPPPLAVAAD